MAFKTGAALEATRAEIAADNQAREAKRAELAAAYEAARNAYQALSSNEQSFIHSIAMKMATGLSLTPRQETWLTDIGARFQK